MWYHSIANETAKQIHYTFSRPDPWLSISGVSSKCSLLSSLAPGHRQLTDCPLICNGLVQKSERVTMMSLNSYSPWIVGVYAFLDWVPK